MAIYDVIQDETIGEEQHPYAVRARDTARPMLTRLCFTSADRFPIRKIYIPHTPHSTARSPKDAAVKSIAWIGRLYNVDHWNLERPKDGEYQSILTYLPTTRPIEILQVWQEGRVQ